MSQCSSCKKEYSGRRCTSCRAIYQAEYHKKNQAKILARKVLYRKENPIACRINSSNYRAKKVKNGGKLSPDIFDRLYLLQKGKCSVCKVSLANAKVHMDHIVSLHSGGENIDSNIQLCCQPCNNKKSYKDPISFMQQNGYLL